MWRQEAFLDMELLLLEHISHKCVDNKDSVATKVANVAKRTFWLESTAIEIML
jgi:hypothetical protein